MDWQVQFCRMIHRTTEACVRITSGTCRGACGATQDEGVNHAEWLKDIGVEKFVEGSARRVANDLSQQKIVRVAVFVCLTGRRQADPFSCLLQHYIRNQFKGVEMRMHH